MMKWAMKLKLNVAFLFGDIGNEERAKGQKRDSRHSIVNHSRRRLPFAVVIESTPKIS
jgi:hypothetical protein